MSFDSLSEKIKSKLEAVDEIEEVYEYPWLDFDGLPAATVIPSDLESDHESTEENLRTYIFYVQVFIQLESRSGRYKKKVREAYNHIRVLMDTVIDVFDQDETLTGVDMPDGKTLIHVKPAPGMIRPMVEKKMLYGEVKLECVVSFDTTA